MAVVRCKIVNELHERTLDLFLKETNIAAYYFNEHLMHK